MSSIAIIGYKELITPLSALGFSVYPAENANEARSKLKQAVEKKDFSIIYILERLAKGLLPEIDLYSEDPKLTIILIPDHRGTTHLQAERIRSLAREAVGTEILVRE